MLLGVTLKMMFGIFVIVTVVVDDIVAMRIEWLKATYSCKVRDGVDGGDGGDKHEGNDDDDDSGIQRLSDDGCAESP